MVPKLAGVVVATGLLVAACGDDGDSGGLSIDPAPSSEETGEVASGPCELLTTDEIAEAAALPFDEGVETEVPDGRNCRWTSTETLPSSTAPFNVTLGLTSFTEDIDALLLEVEETGEGEVVDDLGDRAVIRCGLRGAFCDALGPVIVVTGDRALLVDTGNFATPSDFTVEEMQTLLTSLADQAVDRL